MSEEQLAAFLEAVDDPRFEAIMGEQLYAELIQIKSAVIIDEQRAEKIWNNIDPVKVAVPPAHRIHLFKSNWFRYAAAIIFFVGIGAYLWNTKNNHKETPVAKTDIAPGREGAILTLADGAKILLDSMSNGVVALQNGTQVILKDGGLAYDAAKADAVTFNTMSTPKGRQFSIVLPDNSRAWLNAESSITYPTAFIGDHRTVKIKGEVYFEVMSDPNRPFRVELNSNAEVQVLGTGFNVKAYPDDKKISTTLINGAVRIKSLQQQQTIKPGQQTQIDHSGNLTLVKNADIAKIMAWKNGLFNFQDESLEEAMKQLERWYDIEVKYVGNPPDKKFFGELQRSLTLAQVIETFHEIGIKLKIEGRTLIVTP